MRDFDLHALSLVSSMLISLGLSSACLFAVREPAVSQRFARYHAELDRELRYLQSPFLAGQFVLLQVGGALAIGIIALGLATPWPLTLAPGVVIGPKFWVERLRRTRTAQTEELLDTWLLTLANGLRANPSLGEALEASAHLSAEPLRQELLLAMKEQKLGMPLDRALRQMVERVRSPVMSAAVATLNIARSSGGDLSRTLETAAASLREMSRLEGVVRTKTAEGRAQSAMVGCMPGPLLWGLHSMNPHMFDPLWQTPRGHMLLAAAVLLWIGALLWARKIVAVEV